MYDGEVDVSKWVVGGSAGIWWYARCRVQVFVLVGRVYGGVAMVSQFCVLGWEVCVG